MPKSRIVFSVVDLIGVLTKNKNSQVCRGALLCKDLCVKVKK